MCFMLWIDLLYFLDHLVQDFRVYTFFSFPANCVCIPKDQRVDPLVAVPALVVSVCEHLPLSTAGHLVLEANYTTHNHFFGLWVRWELNRFLLDSLLLHDLSDSDCVTSNHLFTLWYYFIFQLLLQSNKHVRVKCIVNLLRDIDFVLWLGAFLAFHDLLNGLLQIWILKTGIVCKVDRTNWSRFPQSVTQMNYHLGR